jgi:hypothetical protein
LFATFSFLSFRKSIPFRCAAGNLLNTAETLCCRERADAIARQIASVEEQYLQDYQRYEQIVGKLNDKQLSQCTLSEVHEEMVGLMDNLNLQAKKILQLQAKQGLPRGPAESLLS